jgi:hypothetical protein
MAELGTVSIEGVTPPILVALSLSETEEEIGGFSTRRMQSGALRIQEHWSKFRVALSAEGLSPDGLDGIDRGAVLTFMSNAARSIFSTNPAITVPAARRTDGSYSPTTGSAARASRPPSPAPSAT